MKIGIISIDGLDSRNITLLIIALFCIVAFLTWVSAICKYQVEVTWVIKSNNKADHTITYGTNSFSVSAGKPVIRMHGLMGGFNGNIFWGTRGWRIGPEPIFVDGKEVKWKDIRRSSSGEWVIAFISRKARLRIEIQL